MKVVVARRLYWKSGFDIFVAKDEVIVTKSFANEVLIVRDKKIVDECNRILEERDKVEREYDEIRSRLEKKAENILDKILREVKVREWYDDLLSAGEENVCS